MNKFLHKVDTLVTLFCVIDDIVKQLPPFLLSKAHPQGRKQTLSLAELITIGVIFIFSDNNSFKGFYRLIQYNNLFPKLPEYSRLLRNIKATTPITIIILKIILAMNQAHSSQLKFIDSMPLPVCKNKRIFDYHVTELAARGKGSMGWFYGFKLHVVCDHSGKLLNFTITHGNTSDKDHEVVVTLLHKLRGVVVADRGYVSEKLRKLLSEFRVQLIYAPFKNMKKLMTSAQHQMLKLRQLIETVNGRIKYRCSCVSSLPRSFDGYIVNSKQNVYYTDAKTMSE